MLSSLRRASFAALAFAALGATSAHAQSTQSTTGRINIVDPSLVLTKTSDLSFGTIVRPTSGTGTVQIDANSGSVNDSNLARMSGDPATRAAYTVEGQASRNIQVSFPSTMQMTRAGGSESLQVSLSSTMHGGQIGSNGTASFFIGGQVNIPSSTPAGAYQGTFAVTVAYN